MAWAALGCNRSPFTRGWEGKADDHLLGLLERQQLDCLPWAPFQCWHLVILSLILKFLFRERGDAFGFDSKWNSLREISPFQRCQHRFLCLLYGRESKQLWHYGCFFVVLNQLVCSIWGENGEGAHSPFLTHHLISPVRAWVRGQFWNLSYFLSLSVTFHKRARDSHETEPFLSSKDGLDPLLCCSCKMPTLPSHEA